MRRLIAALVACCIFATPSFAFWQSRDSNYNHNISGVVGYAGPFDALGASMPVWYGMRAASAAIAAAGTQALFQVANASTTPASVTCDVLVATSGGIGLTSGCSTGSYSGTSLATFCASGGGSCYGTKFYNQGTAGGADLSYLTANPAKAPTVAFSCVSTLPCFHFASPSGMQGTWPAQSQPINTTIVAERTPSSASTMGVMANAGSWEAGFLTANNMFGFAGTTVTKTATDVVWHALQITYNSSSTAAINVDGTDFTGLNLGANGIIATANRSGIGNQGDGTTDFLTGNWLESGLGTSGSAWSSATRIALCHNSNVYYSTIGLTC